MNLDKVKAHATEHTEIKDCQFVTPCYCIITCAYEAGGSELSNLNFLNHAFNAHIPEHIQTHCRFTSLKYPPSVRSFLSRAIKIKLDPMPYVWNRYDLQPD
jgi:hypothetical protein